MARILVTGASGYIGNVVVDHLLKENHQVVAVDWMVFGDYPLKPFHDNPNFELLRQDIRDLPVRAFRGVDMVCDLAGLPNEQCCAIDPALAHDINLQGRARLGHIAKAMGIKRYIALTSCEAYASDGEQPADEQAALAATGTYAKCNQTLENGLIAASDHDFSATVLRSAQVYGLSRRMRFDLTVNAIALHAHLKRRFVLPQVGAGSLTAIHVRDVARAVIAVIEAHETEISGRIFNLSGENLAYSELLSQAEEVLKGGLDWDINPNKRAKPGRAVSTDAIARATGFAPRISVDQGILEVFIALRGARTQLNESSNTAQFYRSLLKKQNASHVSQTI